MLPSESPDNDNKDASEENHHLTLMQEISRSISVMFLDAAMGFWTVPLKTYMEACAADGKPFSLTEYRKVGGLYRGLSGYLGTVGLLVVYETFMARLLDSSTHLSSRSESTRKFLISSEVAVGGVLIYSPYASF